MNMGSNKHFRKGEKEMNFRRIFRRNSHSLPVLMELTDEQKTFNWELEIFTRVMNERLPEPPLVNMKVFWTWNLVVCVCIAFAIRQLFWLPKDTGLLIPFGLVGLLLTALTGISVSALLTPGFAITQGGRCFHVGSLFIVLYLEIFFTCMWHAVVPHG